MRKIDYPDAVRGLITEFKRLPGIGPRSAERITLWLIGSADARGSDLAAAISSAAKNVRSCKDCGFFSEGDLCAICSDESRPCDPLCVVEYATDILPIEKTGMFRGKYHALGGRIAPLDHVGPEDLRIDVLMARIKRQKPSEIILALSADVEGEATSNYLAEALKPLGVSVSRIAQGLPAGVALDSADELTLSRAFSGRQSI